MNIRRINSNEGNLIKELRIAAISDSPLAFGESLEEAQTKLDREYAASAKLRAVSDSDAFFVVEDQRKYIGIIGAFFENGTNKPFISSMWVHANNRKSNVGAELFFTAKSWLSDRGAKTIHAWVAQDNIVAMSFYKKLGFRATTEIAVMPNDSSRQEIKFIYEVWAT